MTEPANHPGSGPASSRSAAGTVSVIPVAGIGEVRVGDDLAHLIHEALDSCGLHIAAGDVVVVTSKIVSKSLGLHADTTVERAELVLRESVRVVAERRTSSGRTRVVEALAGPVMAGAGIDSSNSDDDLLLLLPRDPDAQASVLHAALVELAGHAHFAVVLSDTSGRAWRSGLTDFALGSHGLKVLEDLRGMADTHGRDLAVTVRNIADEVAAAADLVKGKLDRVPVALVRGMDRRHLREHATGTRALVRSGASDWFSLGRAEAVRDALGVTAGSPLSEQVGIESVHPESLTERITRAWRVALATEADTASGTESDTRAGDDELALDGSEDSWTVLAGDPYLLGRAVARFEVALAGERLQAVTIDRSPAHVTVRVEDGSRNGIVGPPAR